MKALILAGGEGLRLRPLTDTTPKPLLPIGNVPFLEHQVRLLSGHGIREVILLTGYLPEAFEGFAARMSDAVGIRFTVSREESPLDTAGAVRSVLDRLDGPTLVLNGDILTDLDLGALLASHRERAAAVTIALTHVDDAGAYGLVPLGGDGRVEAFVEKPPPEVARRGGLINGGTYVIEPHVLAGIPPGVPWSFERQLFPGLLEAGAAVDGFPSRAYWIDIGTPARYLQAHWDILDGKVRVRLEGALRREGPGAPALVGPGSRVAGGVHVGPYAVLGAGVEVAAGVTVQRSVLLAGAAAGAGARIRGSIVGAGAAVSAGSTVEDAILGDREGR